MEQILWLDDARNPADKLWHSYFPCDGDVVWVKTYNEFVEWVETNGLPIAVCFDHDIGADEPTGYDAAKWLVDYCGTNGKYLPLYSVQSANVVGKANIISLLETFKRLTGEVDELVRNTNLSKN